MTRKHNSLIGGEWIAGTGYTPNINPSDLLDVIGEYTQASAEQLDAAVQAARAAFPAWSISSIQARANAPDKIGTETLARREELGTLLAREESKTTAEGIGEAARAGNIFKFFAGLKYATHFKRHSQVGMVMVNLPTAGVDYHVPFGGRKGSSYGPREQGRYAQEFYTVVKTAYTLA